MRQGVACLGLLAVAAELAADGNFIDIDASDPSRNIVGPAEKDILLDAKMIAPESVAGEDFAVVYARLEQLVEDRLLDEADAEAKKLIELAIRSSGAGSAQAARALTNLAIVQHMNEQFDAAQSNYQSAIEIIEDVEDRLNTALVNPLKGLAAAQLENGRPDLASKTYRRAVHITHVNHGPYNTDQLQILKDLSDVQLMMGNVDEARELQDVIYSVDAHHYGADTLDIIPSLMRLAEWQHDAGLIIAERDTYRSAIRIVEKRLGDDDPAMVDPLVRLGRSYFYLDISGDMTFQKAELSRGEIYLKRAVRIAATSSNVDWRMVASSSIALGDFYTFTANRNRARQVYRGAWNLLSENDASGEKLALRQANFEQPVILRQQSLPDHVGEAAMFPGGDTDDPVLEGYVTIRFDVGERGRPSNIEVVEAVPSGLSAMIEAGTKEISRRIYRPRLEDGEPVTAAGQLFRHDYYYRNSDLETARLQAADTTAE